MPAFRRTSGFCVFAVNLVLLCMTVPAHEDSVAFESRPIGAASAKGDLAGTLQLPGHIEPPYNTVLIIPGSGATDRDGNTPGGVTASTYRLLAEGVG